MLKTLKWKIFVFICTTLFVAHSSGDNVDNSTDTTTTAPEVLGQRIYRGDKATMHYPFMVSIKVGESYICGGALVDNENLVTAAHCVISMRKKSSEVRFVLGSFNLMEKPVMERGLKKCWVPEFYKPGDVRSRGDIGVCRFDKPVEFSSNVKSLCISKTYAKKVSVTLIGFGRIDGVMHTQYLQYASGKTLLNEKCKEPVIKESQVCAILRNKKRKKAEQAKGDSGGPLFSKAKNGKYNLIGVVSYNFDFLESNGTDVPDFKKPGVYTRASSYTTSFLPPYAKIDTDC